MTTTEERADRLIGALQRRFPRLPKEDAWQYAAEAIVQTAFDEEAVRQAVLRVKKDGWDDPLVFPRDREDEEGHRILWEATLGDAGAGAARIEDRAAALFPSQGRPEHRRSRVSIEDLWPLLREAIAALPSAHQKALWCRWGPLLAGKKPASYRAVAQAAQVSLGGAWNIEQRAMALLRTVVERRLRRPPKATQLSWLDPDSAGG